METPKPLSSVIIANSPIPSTGERRSSGLISPKHCPPYLAGVPPRFNDACFGNFQVTDDNRQQVEICKDWLRNRDKDGLVLTGGAGVGKTHLAVALLRNVPGRWQRLPDDKYNIMPGRGLFLPMVEALTVLNENAMLGKSKLQLIEEWFSYDMLVLDDFGAERQTEAAVQNIFMLIDRAYRQCSAVIITSNYTIEQIDAAFPRIASRFSEMARILHFNSPDYRVYNENKSK